MVNEKLEKFIKLMMMTTSSHDGECLNAIRMANAELVKINMNWEDLIRGRVKLSHDASHDKQRHDQKADDINEMFERAFENVSKSSSFYKFLESIHAWWEEKGFLTPAQHQALYKASRS